MSKRLTPEDRIVELFGEGVSEEVAQQRLRLAKALLSAKGPQRSRPRKNKQREAAPVNTAAA